MRNSRSACEALKRAEHFYKEGRIARQKYEEDPTCNTHLADSIVCEVFAEEECITAVVYALTILLS